jgi:hypothetical protein
MYFIMFLLAISILKNLQDFTFTLQPKTNHDTNPKN